MSVTSLKVFERECWVSSSWLVYYSMMYYVLQPSWSVTVCVVFLFCCDVCMCVYGSRHNEWLLVTVNELCVYGWVGSAWLGMARHVTVHCLQNGVDESEMVSMTQNDSKSSLSQQRNRADAITTGISCDFLRLLSKKVMISAITETKSFEKGGFLWSSLFLKL